MTRAQPDPAADTVTDPPPADDQACLLEATGIGHRFGMRQALDDVTLHLFGGEVLAIVGESGSGKSTLLNCLAGRLAPQQGRVRYRDRDGQWLDVHALPETRRRLLARSGVGIRDAESGPGLRPAWSAPGRTSASA
ncbi:MAG: ATP-binding cassette domain-containing protein [Burkholderiaceae bacterium]